METLTPTREKSKISVKDLNFYYGKFHALKGINLEIPENKVTAFIGPSGCGKSTLLRVFNRMFELYPEQRAEGKIILDGEDLLTSKKDVALIRAKIGMVFQKPTPFPMSIYDNIAFGVRLFENMTVIENVMVGCHSWTRQGIASGALRWIGHWREERLIIEESHRQLGRVGLEAEAGADAASLPFGKQRMLEIARALAGHPQVLMLDEPASGLSTRETAELSSLLRQIVSEGVTVLLVDHDMQFVMDISDEVTVLDQGRTIAEGTPEQVQSDAAVIAAYLGTEPN